MGTGGGGSRGTWWLAAAWGIGVATVAVSAAMPDPYYRRAIDLDPGAPLAYPFAGALLFTAIVTVECALLCAILRPGSYHRSWNRAAIAAALAAFLALFFSLGLMHAPNYMAGHVWWLIGVTLGLGSLFVVSLWAALSAARKAR